MPKILRNILAVIAGFIVASVVMTIVEYANGHALYPELGKAAEGVMDREKVRFLMATAPVGALIVVLAGWLLGSIAGGWTAARIAKPGSFVPVLILAILLTLSGVVNNLMIPPPIWFWVAGVVVLPVATFLGARLVKS